MGHPWLDPYSEQERLKHGAPWPFVFVLGTPENPMINYKTAMHYQVIKRNVYG
jgi:hypothetical protein